MKVNKSLSYNLELREDEVLALIKCLKYTIQRESMYEEEEMHLTQMMIELEEITK